MGCNSPSLRGNRVLVLRLCKLCAGELPIPSMGVLRKSKNANSGSWPVSKAFWRLDLAVFTLFSVMCSITSRHKFNTQGA